MEEIITFVEKPNLGEIIPIDKANHLIELLNDGKVFMDDFYDRHFFTDHLTQKQYAFAYAKIKENKKIIFSTEYRIKKTPILKNN